MNSLARGDAIKGEVTKKYSIVKVNGASEFGLTFFQKCKTLYQTIYSVNIITNFHGGGFSGSLRVACSF
jgi:hypothetical protein